VLRADDKSLLSRTAGSVEYGRADAIDAPNLRRKLLGEISLVLIGDRTTALVGARVQSSSQTAPMTARTRFKRRPHRWACAARAYTHVGRPAAEGFDITEPDGLT